MKKTLVTSLIASCYVGCQSTLSALQSPNTYNQPQQQPLNSLVIGPPPREPPPLPAQPIPLPSIYRVAVSPRLDEEEDYIPNSIRGDVQRRNSRDLRNGHYHSHILPKGRAYNRRFA